MNLWNLTFYKSSVIRQKGKSQNGGNKKTKQVTYVRGSVSKKCSFSGKFDVLCNLVTSGLKFALVPYYQRNVAVTRLHRVNINSGYFSMSHNLLCLILSFLLQWNIFKYIISYLSGAAFCPIKQTKKRTCYFNLTTCFAFEEVMLPFSFL